LIVAIVWIDNCAMSGDRRKGRLIFLAKWIVIGGFANLLILGLYMVLFDWFGWNYMRTHEWKSVMDSLNKAIDWKALNWKGWSGLVFVSSSVCTSLTMYVQP
jgi:hypothetical protein